MKVFLFQITLDGRRYEVWERDLAGAFLKLSQILCTEGLLPMTHGLQFDIRTVPIR